MYSIYADGQLVYAPNLKDEGYIVTSPEMSLELNKAGSLSFVLPPTNPAYNLLKKLQSTVTVKWEDSTVFRGRVLHDERDFYNRKEVYCEGSLAFLLDVCTLPYTWSCTLQAYITAMLNEYNNKVNSDRQFSIGSIESMSTATLTFTNQSCSTIWDELNSQVIEVYGGYFRVRVESSGCYIDYVASSVNIDSRTVEFGIDMLDMSQYISAEDLFTILVPLGATSQDSETGEETTVDITSVNGGLNYIENTTASALYGRIWRAQTWSDVEDASVLLSEATTYLNNNVALATTLTISAADLVDSPKIDTPTFRIGDYIKVISTPHGLNAFFQCSGAKVKLDDPSGTEYTFGVPRVSATSVQVSSAGSVQASVQNLQNYANSLALTFITTTTFSALEQRVQSTESQITAHGGRITTLESKVTTLESKVTTLESNTSTLQTSVDSLTTNVNTITSNISDLQTQDSAFSDQIDAINTQIEDTKKSLSSLTTTVDNLDQDISTLDSDVADTQDQITAISEQITTIDQQITAINEQIAALDERITALEGGTET